MIKNEAEKTSLKVRIIVVGAAVLLVFSTIAMYMGIMMNYRNSDSGNMSQAEYQKLSQRYTELSKRQDQKADEISQKYFKDLVQYRKEVKGFNAADVKDVQKKDLKKGSGPEIKKGYSDYASLYIGWLKDETIFDSSFDDKDKPSKIKSFISEKQNKAMIEGWNRGVEGMHVGGVREITIPSSLAYGDKKRGDIPANSVLKFIVMAIPPVGDNWTDEMNQLRQKMFSYYMMQTKNQNKDAKKSKN